MNDLRKIGFWCLGSPACKGSTHALKSKTTGKIVTLPMDQKLKLWTAQIRLAASQRWPGGATQRPCRIVMSFVFARPKSHYTAKGSIKPTAPPAPRKDWDKLARAVGDALTSVVYADDVLVVDARVTKRWDDTLTGVFIVVEELA